MSNAWEVTEEDVKTVLDAHKPNRFTKNPYDMGSASITREVFGIILDNADAVEKAALRYDDMDDQQASALDEIENLLVADGILAIHPFEKKFHPSDWTPPETGPGR